MRQQVIATLGRIEDLRDSGQLERLLRSGARFAAKAIVVNAVADGAVTANAARRIGPALVFERLWEETGCRKVIEDLAGSRKHGFPLERAVVVTVLHRLFAGGSDRAADRWREDYAINGVEDLDLHHVYRAMAWLGEELGEDQQDGAITGGTYYVATNGGLASAIANGPLSTIVGGNGTYGNSGAYPTNSWQTSNYYRDVVFTSGAQH